MQICVYAYRAAFNFSTTARAIEMVMVIVMVKVMVISLSTESMQTENAHAQIFGELLWNITQQNWSVHT